MMKIAFVLAVVGLACVVLMGCAGYARAPVVPPVGWIYTKYTAPMDIDVDDTPVTGKKGTATSENILGAVAFGDASLKAAAENGGITKVEHVDYEFFNVLGVYSKFTTIVYGQ